MRTLVLGGVKSGKSRYAETLAAQRHHAVDYIATARDSGDAEMQARIARHRQQRPAHWQLFEAPIALPERVAKGDGARLQLIECLTLWTTNLLLEAETAIETVPTRAGTRDGQSPTALERAHDALVAAVSNATHDVVLVSNETNLGVVPANAMARQYCDAMGCLHQRLAAVCDEVVLVVAGLPLVLKSSASHTLPSGMPAVGDSEAITGTGHDANT